MSTLTKQQLEEASHAYYTGNPVMSDEEFDKAFEDFIANNPNEVIIGYKPSPSRERTLPIPMYSLNKKKSIEDVQKWLHSNLNSNNTNIELILTPKYDGISACVYEWEFPERRRASTRGDGRVGQSFDPHYSFMNSGDNGDNHPIISFGEAIMSKKNFAKYDKSNGGLYKNARNLVGSQINADKPTLSILKDIDYIRYGYVDVHAMDAKSTRAGQIDYLNTINTVQVPYKVIDSESITHDLIMGMYDLWSKNHDIDGIVIEINDLHIAQSMGRDTSGNPSYAVAYKGHFENSEITEVQGITWQVSKHGKLKPVINIESVRLSGVDVTNVTGYNARHIMNSRIGAGAIVSVVRSGAVIPKITEVHNGVDVTLPTHCPECGKPVRMGTEVELMCYNSLCKGRVISNMTSFFAILKCKEVGRGTMESFYKTGYTTIESVLDMSIDDMKTVDKYGDKKATKIHTEIHKCLDGVRLSDLMHASGCFKDIGGDTIQTIIGAYMPDDSGNMNELTNVGKHDMTAYHNGIEYFNEFYENIKKHVKISGVETAKTNKLADLNVVFTGFRSSNLESLIKENGGIIGSGVSSKTTHLVMAQVGSGTTKEKKALDLGKAIMDEETFTNYINTKLNG